MSDHGHGTHAAGQAHDAHHVDYVKVYWWLVGLFMISFIGPFIGEALHMKWLTLVTAFGIAIAKAYLVAANFMHLKVEKKFVSYLLLTALAFMFLFYAGVSPDVMKHRGRGWENVAAQTEVDRAMKAAEAAPAHH